MTGADGVTFQVRLTPSARRSLNALPVSVAAAAINLMSGDLADSPRRVGKALLPPLDGQYSARRGEYRIRYRIDDTEQTVTVLDVRHRRDAYRR